MPDVVDPATRSRMMAGIRGKNTKPELVVRRALHAAGFRYRLHCAELPGKPDLCFRRRRAVIFVHGCFWHGHDCALFKWPSTRPEFWKTKIERNRSVDQNATHALHRKGWRVAVIWECALKGATQRPINMLVTELAAWLESDKAKLEIRGG